MMNLGRGNEWDPEDFDSVASVIPAFKFGIVTTVLESKYARDVDEGGVREALGDVHDFFLLDVVKKGYLGKKMDLVRESREKKQKRGETGLLMTILRPYCSLNISHD